MHPNIDSFWERFKGGGFNPVAIQSRSRSFTRWATIVFWNFILSNRSVCPLITTSNAFRVCLLWKKLSYEDDVDDDDDGDKDADENVMT